MKIRKIDRLIEDETRRKQGAFFTPMELVDKSHIMIEEVLGSDWKKKYTVWDCCAGTGNLTRDYKFKNLYSSTIDRGEHNLKIKNKLNPEAIHFVYDFLKEWNLPSEIIKAFENKEPIVFYINPPYGTACNGGANTKSKAGIAKTGIHKDMEGVGACRQNLYIQFLYKIARLKEIYGLTNVNVCMFTPQTFLTASSFKKFRRIWFGNFSYQKGLVIQGSKFTNVTDKMGILFSIWKTGKTENSTIEVEIDEDNIII